MFALLESSDSKDISERLNTAAHNSAISSLNSLGWTLGLNSRQLWRFLGTHSICMYQGFHFVLIAEQMTSRVLHFLLRKWIQAPISVLQPRKLIQLLNSCSTHLPVGTQRSTSSLDRFKFCWIFFCLVILLDRHTRWNTNYPAVTQLLSQRIYFSGGQRLNSAFSRATVFSDFNIRSGTLQGNIPPHIRVLDLYEEVATNC